MDKQKLKKNLNWKKESNGNYINRRHILPKLKCHVVRQNLPHLDMAFSSKIASIVPCFFIIMLKPLKTELIIAAYKGETCG